MDFKLNIQLFGDNNNDSHRGYMEKKSHEQKMRSRGYKYVYGGKWFKTEAEYKAYKSAVRRSNMMDSGGGHGATDNGSLAGDGINHGAGWGSGIKNGDAIAERNAQRQAETKQNTLSKKNSLNLDTQKTIDSMSGWQGQPNFNLGIADGMYSPNAPSLGNYIDNPEVQKKGLSKGGLLGAGAGLVLGATVGAPTALIGAGYYLGNKLNGDKVDLDKFGKGSPVNATDHAGRGGSETPVISAPKKDEEKKPVSGELETPIEAPNLNTGRMYLYNKFRRDTHRLGLGDVISAFGKSEKANSILWKF